VTTARHQEALSRARDSLLQASETVLQAMPADFITIDVRGAIVLIRYGAAFRGALVRNAQDAGRQV